MKAWRWRSRVGGGVVGVLALGLAAVVAAAQEPVSSAVVSAAAVPAAGARDSRWAQPLTKPGLPNLHKVSGELYRGAQPSAEGIRTLHAMGIKTIVNLRGFHSDRDEIGDTSIAVEEISFKTWHPEEDDVLRFLKVVTDKDRLPVFVHCQHGADRTGTMCAIYRILVQGWSKDDAIEEMTKGGYGYHAIWTNLIQYLRDLDVDALRKKLEAGRLAP